MRQYIVCAMALVIVTAPLYTFAQTSTPEVVLVWEVIDGYTPPLYKGATLPVAESVVRATALSTTSLASSPYSFLWQKNGANVAGMSGQGKSSYVVPLSYIDTATSLGVTVNTPTGVRIGQKATTITPIKPEFYFYEKIDGFGVNYADQLEGGERFTKNTVRIVAEPYFVTDSFLTSEATTLAWKVNGQEIPQQPRKNQINIERTQAGEVDIRAIIDTTKKVFQNGTRDLSFFFE